MKQTIKEKQFKEMFKRKVRVMSDNLLGDLSDIIMAESLKRSESEEI